MIIVFLLDMLLLIALLILGLPIVFCFSAAIFFVNIFVHVNMIGLFVSAFSKITDPMLLTIPLFILSGGLMSESGISDALLDFVDLFIGRIKGALGVVVTVTCGIMGAISGSGMSGVAAVGPILMPRMLKEGYTRGYSAALISCSSLLGLLIPPSVLTIVYGWVTGTSILACFLATIGPGLTIMLLFSIINLISVRKMPLTVQQQPLINFKERWKKILICTCKALPAILVPIIVLGGIYGGIFTPSEAAAVAVIVSLVIGFFVYRVLKMKNFYGVVKESATGTGSIMIQSFVALMLAQILVMNKVPQEIITFLFGLTEHRYLILFIVNMYLFLQGMIVGDVTGTILIAPLLFPLIKELGISPVHFGAILATNLAMGGVTPPFSPTLYLGLRVCKAEFTEVLKPTLKLVIFGYIPVVFITTYWPALSLFLPRLLGYAP